MSAPAPYTAYERPEFFELQWLAPSVLGVAFHRPPVNAFHVAMWTEMHRIFQRIKIDGDVRVVVLSGNGRCFTAVTDAALQDVMNRSDPARVALALRELIERFQQAITSIETCERPVIGVSHGHAIGLAVDILSAADIRYTTQDVNFSIREAAVGLAADIGTLQRFPKIVGNDSLVRELVYTARFFHAEEALKIGFVSRVFDTRDAAMQAAIATATQISSVSPVAVTGSKQALVYSRDHSVDEGLRFMQQLNSALLQTDDLMASLEASMTKTKPTFAKL